MSQSAKKNINTTNMIQMQLHRLLHHTVSCDISSWGMDSPAQHTVPKCENQAWPSVSVLREFLQNWKGKDSVEFKHQILQE
jgi:hypothetical protein